MSFFLARMGSNLRGRRGSPQRRPGTVLIHALLTASLPFPVFLTGCAQQKIVRVEVPAENILRANEVSQEGDLAFARRDYYAALIKFLEASRLNPNSYAILNKLGIAYSQLKYYSDAGPAFQRAITLNPKFSYAYNNLGTVYFATDDKSRAEKLFKKAIALQDDAASFHINLGTLYFEKGKYQKGMAELRKGLMLDPGIGGRGEGMALAQAPSKGSSNEKNYFMARVYASMGDVDRAVESLKQALGAGFTDIDAIRKEPDFDKIRQDTKFIAFMRQATLMTKN
jgi:tetratricopeptide (TPR) repeat protein